MRRIICILLTALCLPFVSFLFIACKEGADSGIRYEITAEYLPEDEAIFATQKVTYENRTEGVKDTLRFALYPNAYRKNAVYKPVSATYQPLAYYAGESYGGVTITSVLGGRGWQVCGEDENILAVELETPLYTGDEVVLDISFVTSLAKVNHRTGVCKKSVNLGNFYPILCADLPSHYVNQNKIENYRKNTECNSKDIIIRKGCSHSKDSTKDRNSNLVYYHLDHTVIIIIKKSFHFSSFLIIFLCL